MTSTKINKRRVKELNQDVNRLTFQLEQANHTIEHLQHDLRITELELTRWRTGYYPRGG